MLLGGKRPVHSHSSSQPRSSLYLWEDQRESQEPCTLYLLFCPRTEQTRAWLPCAQARPCSYLSTGVVDRAVGHCLTSEVWDSPSLFGQALTERPAVLSLNPSFGSSRLLYIDGLLDCSPCKLAADQNTVLALQKLGLCGCETSSKTQISLQQGHLLSLTRTPGSGAFPISTRISFGQNSDHKIVTKDLPLESTEYNHVS